MSLFLTLLTSQSFDRIAALGAEAMNGYFKSCGLETFRQSDAVGTLAGQVNIEHFGAAVAVKVAMLPHIWAKTRRPTIDVHLPRHTALHQRVEAIVNRRHGNIRHLALGADENFLGRRMIPLLDQHIINVLTLRGEPKAARRELPAQMFIQFFMFDAGHSSVNLWPHPASVKIWNNSKSIH
jgi:hypothetical protein